MSDWDCRVNSRCSFDLVMKLLNVEMYTVIKDIKSRRVTLLMLQMCLTCLLLPLIFSPSPCCAGRFLASFRSSFSHLVPDDISEVYVKKTKAPETTTVWHKQTKHNDPVSEELESLRSGMNDNMQNVALKTPREHVERSSALWIRRRSAEAGLRRRLKWGKWMWCIYRASAQWLFDLPASSLPLPTTI